MTISRESPAVEVQFQSVSSLIGRITGKIDTKRKIGVNCLFLSEKTFREIAYAEMGRIYSKP